MKVNLNTCLPAGSLFLLLLVASACSKEPAETTVYQLMGNATPALQSDTITGSQGFATLSGTYNSGTKTLQYTLTWRDLSGPPRGIHFHGPSLPRSTSNPVVDIEDFVPGEAGSVSGSASIPENQEKDLLAQRWTFQFHTSRYRAGEIKGYVIAK